MIPLERLFHRPSAPETDSFDLAQALRRCRLAFVGVGLFSGMINILMLIAGTFLEVVPIMLIMVPLFVPVMLAVGVDPIHLGIIIVINSVLGSLTPPVGILVFICASIAKVPANAVFRECNPFLIACGIGLLVITYIPALSLTLWKLIGH